MEAVIYTRTSTKAQKTDSQIKTLQDYARRAGVTDPIIIEDQGVSGSKAPESREGFSRILSLVDQRAIHSVIVYSVDRLGRSLKDIIEIAQRLEDKGVSLVIVKNGIDTSTGHGKHLLSFLGIVAEIERDFIRGRIKDGLAAAKARGKRLGRPKTYLTESQKNEIRAERQRGTALGRIARHHGVGVSQVYRVLEQAERRSGV